VWCSKTKDANLVLLEIEEKVEDGKEENGDVKYKKVKFLRSAGTHFCGGLG
jgi:hypothetical protein